MMWNMSPIVAEDMESIVLDKAIDFEKLDGKTIVVSGATGLIGRTLVNALIYYGSKTQNPPLVIALVRDEARAAEMFSAQMKAGAGLKFVKWSAEQSLTIEEKVDYIIHGASQTSSSGFVQTPVETVKTAYLGTENMLSFAREKGVKGMVYLSTMEVYGTPQTDEKISETYVGKIDPLRVRNCYPESKRLCENLCASYASEYGVPVNIARLTQTFGPGVSSGDLRVFAEFARCVVNGTDIVLHTEGKTKRNYLYTADAVRALLILLLHGEAGQAYNVANENTYCSIFEMATMVADEIAGGAICVKLDLNASSAARGYAPVLHMNLCTEKLRGLGWKPSYELQDMFRRMIQEF